MNVNDKGVKGLIKTLDDLGDKGYYCFTAFDDHSPVDLIAMDRKGATYKLQVKYRSMTAGQKERYILPAVSVVNGRATLIDKSLIDGWAFYMADHGKLIYVPVEAVKGRSLTLYPDSDFGWL